MALACSKWPDALSFAWWIESYVAIVLPFRRALRSPVTAVPLAPREPVLTMSPLEAEQVLDRPDSAEWMATRWAVLAKAPDWETLPDIGRALRLRGLMDDDGRRAGLHLLPDYSWEIIAPALGFMHQRDERFRNFVAANAATETQAADDAPRTPPIDRDR